MNRTVLLLGLTSLLTDVGTEMTYPLLPAFLLTLGAGPWFLGLMEGIADTVSAFLKLYAGRLTDRIPRAKPLVLAGYGLAGAVKPLTALAAAPWHVLAVRAIDRVGKGIRTAPRDVLIARSVGDADAGFAYGFHRAMDHAGAVAGPLIAGALVAAGVDVRTIFAVTLVPGVLAVMCVGLVREVPRTAASIERRAAEGAHTALPARTTRFFVWLFVFALGNAADAFVLVRAAELGVPAAVLPLLWAWLHVWKAGLSVAGGALSDRFGPLPLIVAGRAAFAVAFAGLAFAETIAEAWLWFAVLGAYFGFAEPAEKAWVRDAAPAALRGAAFGRYNFTVGVAAIPAGLLVGGLWQYAGGPAALAFAAAAAALSAAGTALDTRLHGADDR